ncbi:MAG: hypothetical protein AABY01_02800 [Nanoarchaeota archaeon]
MTRYLLDIAELKPAFEQYAVYCPLVSHALSLGRDVDAVDEFFERKLARFEELKQGLIEVGLSSERMRPQLKFTKSMSPERFALYAGDQTQSRFVTEYLNLANDLHVAVYRDCLPPEWAKRTDVFEFQYDASDVVHWQDGKCLVQRVALLDRLSKIHTSQVTRVRHMMSLCQVDADVRPIESLLESLAKVPIIKRKS